jgi:6-phosphogluconate dehydrogenase
VAARRPGRLASAREAARDNLDGERAMQLGIIGLGRMGGNMLRRLLERGHEPVGYDRAEGALAEARARGARTAASLAELARLLRPPRAVWMMVPHGAAVEATLEGLVPHLAAGDLVVDGGNSRWSDAPPRAARLETRGIAFLDAGTSGGVWGLERGYCLMVGGAEDAYRRLTPVLDALAQEGGHAHVGPSGAGHFVKMVHNAIEYGMLQAFGEGFEMMRAAPFPLQLDRVAELWRHGSVVQSWLLDLLAAALARSPELADVRGWVEDSGEGRWSLEYAVEHAVPAGVLAQSLFARFASRQEESFAARVVAALRREFGGHAVRGSAGGA